MAQRFLVALMVAFLVAGLGAPAAGAAGPPAADAPLLAAVGQAVPGQYIVTVKDGHLPVGIARSLGIAPLFEYNAVVNGFAARLTAGQLQALRRHPHIAQIEEDQEASVGTTQNGATWGLDWSDQRALPLSSTYTYARTGAGISAYIIDTGIQTGHPEFGGRASVAYDAIGGNGQDCNGHGTHVAGTVGGATYGVAKGVALRAVRVLDCSGSGTYSQVIAGINWVAANRAGPAVANLSLGGSYSASLNAAVTNLVNRGVFIAVAAGNSGTAACNASPASAAGVLTVAASDRTDARASFSNYGSCVEVYAPGVNITSAWLNGGTATISGTSMASPHAAGVAALYKATYGDVASATIVNWIVGNATTNAIKSNPAGTPNKLLYKGGL